MAKHHRLGFSREERGLLKLLRPPGAIEAETPALKWPSWLPKTLPFNYAARPELTLYDLATRHKQTTDEDGNITDDWDEAFSEGPPFPTYNTLFNTWTQHWLPQI